MKKKNKEMSPEEIEAVWDDLPSIMEERAPAILKRNAELRAKDARVNTRVNSESLEKFKTVAGENRMKYQTLLGEVIHFIGTRDAEAIVRLLQPSNRSVTEVAKALNMLQGKSPKKKEKRPEMRMSAKARPVMRTVTTKKATG